MTRGVGARIADPSCRFQPTALYFFVGWASLYAGENGVGLISIALENLSNTFLFSFQKEDCDDAKETQHRGMNRLIKRLVFTEIWVVQRMGY